MKDDWDGRKFCNQCGRPERYKWICPACSNNEWSLNENPTYYGWKKRLEERNKNVRPE